MKPTRFECHLAASAMQAIFPGSAEMGLSDIRAMNVEAFFCELMTHLPFRAALGVRLALWLVIFSPLFVLYRFATFTQLALQERERVIAVLFASESYAVRSLVLILKTLGALLYAADQGVRMRIAPARPAARLRVTYS